MAKLKEAARAAALEITTDPAASRAVASLIEPHMRSLLEQATDVARLWAVVRGQDHQARWAAEELARELRHVMEGA